MIWHELINNVCYPDQTFGDFDERDRYEDKIEFLKQGILDTEGQGKKFFQDTLNELELRWKEKQTGLSWKELVQHWRIRQNTKEINLK